jgi:hypothetical protein
MHRARLPADRAPRQQQPTTASGLRARERRTSRNPHSCPFAAGCVLTSVYGRRSLFSVDFGRYRDGPPPGGDTSIAVKRRVDMCAPARIRSEPLQAMGQTYLSCKSGSESTRAPRSCHMRAYDTTQETMVDIAFRSLLRRRWGTLRVSATGQYAVSGAGWNPVSLTASGRTSYGELAAAFYTRLSVLDSCACGFLGPGRGFVLDTPPPS